MTSLSISTNTAALCAAGIASQEGKRRDFYATTTTSNSTESSDSSVSSDDEDYVIRDWSRRCVAQNDQFLRETFDQLLSTSMGLPPDQRLVMYAADDDQEIKESLGMFRKRFDPRRGKKPNKPNDQSSVCTPFDPNGFNFSKIKNPGERLLELQLGGSRYELLTNKFPLYPRHMLLVCKELVPQQVTLTHLLAVTELLRASSFCAYFNSWCASASVNHFHCHIIDELPPIGQLPLVPGAAVRGVQCLQPQGFPGHCYVFKANAAGINLVGSVIEAMQEDNQPHNLLFSSNYIYVWPKPHTRPKRSFSLYPETVGGPELIGSFTVYDETDYAKLTADAVAEAARINTAPLPSRLLASELASLHAMEPLPLMKPGRIPQCLESPNVSYAVLHTLDKEDGDASPTSPTSRDALLVDSDSESAETVAIVSPVR